MLSGLLQADLDPARRRLLAAGVYSPTTLALPAPAAPRGPAPSATVDVPSRARIEQMDALTRQFADAAHKRQRQLLPGAAQLTLLLGTATADDGADALAQYYHRTAAHMAADADDRALFAIALRMMATHATDLGHHTTTVLHLSEQAAETARRSPRPVRAYTQAQLATAAARHDRHTALTALTAAEHLYEQADTASGPFTDYPLSALHYERAQTLNALGDIPGAIGAYTAALRLRTPVERHASALTRAALAETLLTHGHLDAALTHWTRFLDDYPHLHSTRATRRLTTLRQLLTPHQRHRPAARLLEQAALLG